MQKIRSIVTLLLIGVAVAHASPREAGSSDRAAAALPAPRDVDALRRSYIELRRDVLLAGPALVPGPGQLAVYVSIDPRATASLEALSLEIDGVVAAVARDLPSQRDALHRGATAPIFIGPTTRNATHLAATLSGTRADGNPFVVTAALDVPESAAPRYVQIELSHTQTDDRPDVIVRAAATEPATAVVVTPCDWLLGCTTVSAAAAADLQYRSILLAMYRDDTEQALINALALAAAAPDDPVLRARLLLAQLHAASATDNRSLADAAVAALDAETLEPALRARFAFLYARESHRRQDWTALQRALAQLDTARRGLNEAQPVPPSIDAEIAFMRAELAVADGDFDRAQSVIATGLSPRDDLRAYALFNLGVKLRTAGMPTRAERVFTQLATMPVYSPDALDLKGRARLALAAIELQRTQSASAEAALRDAPAQGRYHDQFMVSYGTRAMEHGDYELAARIWLTLAGEAPWSTAGKTAQVAYPMCLEHIAAPSMVLTHYRDAELNFKVRLGELDTLIARTEDPTWDAQLLEALTRSPRGLELRADPTLSEWRTRIGHDDWLYWFNADSTQQQLQELSELMRMSAWLSGAQPPAFVERAHALDVEASRLAGDRRAQLSRAISAIARNEVAMAQEQLRLIRVGIARTTDRIADAPAKGATR
jgi:hypothetical protein